MTSSLSITLIALGIIAALAFFTAAGFRGSGKVSDYAPNLSKYRNDDDLETKTPVSYTHLTLPTMRTV